MNHVIDQLLVGVMLINILILGARGTRLAIRAIAAQGIMLGLIPLLSLRFELHVMILTLFILLAKGVCIPLLLLNAMKKHDFSEGLLPFLGYSGNIIAGAIATWLAFVVAGWLPLLPAHQGLLIVPASIATILAGFISLTSRRKAINLVVAYLLLENGIFLFGQLLTETMPMMVEAGALLDLIAAIFVMAIIINQISREFASLDTGRMTALREVE